MIDCKKKEKKSTLVLKGKLLIEENQMQMIKVQIETKCIKPMKN